MSDFHYAICGAGPVGAAMALLLAQVRNNTPENAHNPAQVRIALLDARSAADCENDPRMIALSWGSRSLLERLGVWHAGLGTPIHRIHVSQRGSARGLFGRTVIDRAEHGVPELGTVVRYGDLVRSLHKALARTGVTVLRPEKVVGSHLVENMNRIECESGLGLRANYLIHAEGGIFSSQTSQPIRRDYQQHAIVAIVTASHPHPATAWERFTPEGPIALLPTTVSGKPAYALVWCSKPDLASARLALDDAAFLAALHQGFGDRVGQFQSVSARHSYPLGLNAATEIAHDRTFIIGNAAQTLHPVAGQGLNLGLRDAFLLAASLREHFETPDTGIRAFNTARRSDRIATIGLTDTLPRIFSSDFFPLAAARSAALLTLDIVAPLRKPLARQMMVGWR